MQREWYLIDDEGIHPVDLGEGTTDFWGQFRHPGDEAPWPPFSQLVCQATPAQVVAALEATAGVMEVELEDVTASPERWSTAVVVAEAQGLSVVSEPGVELDDRVIGLPWSEALVEELGCSGAFFGYDPAASTLYLTRFEDGVVTLAWSDSLMPGPSYAMVFDEDGRTTDEDPRRFALREMGLPETSPLLDRYEFMKLQLKKVPGLSKISPNLDDFPVARVLTARATSQRECQ